MGKVDTDYLKTGNDYRAVYLITGDYRVMDIKMLVGYCHCGLHKGFVTKNLYKHHACAEKKCPFLEKFHDYPYWENKRKMEQEKAYQKDLERRRKMKVQAEKEWLEKHLNGVSNDAEKLSRKWKYDIAVTSVKRTGMGEYTIFYVSNRRDNDWASYMKLSRILSALYNARFTLTRVVMPDGRFATIGDWQQVHRYTG